MWRDCRVQYVVDGNLICILTEMLHKTSTSFLLKERGGGTSPWKTWHLVHLRIRTPACVLLISRYSFIVNRLVMIVLLN